MIKLTKVTSLKDFCFYNKIYEYVMRSMATSFFTTVHENVCNELEQRFDLITNNLIFILYELAENDNI